MKLRLIIPLFSAFILMLLNACDVVELVVYEKKVSALREGVANQNVSINNGFEKFATLNHESFISSIEIPEGGKIDSIYLSSVSIAVLEREGNEMADGKISVFANLVDGSQYLFIDNLNVTIGEKLNVQSTNLKLENLRSQLNELFTSSDADTDGKIEFTYLILEKPGLTLNWDIELEIGLNAKITYCSMVPGESELPDC